VFTETCAVLRGLGLKSEHDICRFEAGLALLGVRLVTWSILAVTWTILAVTWTILAVTWTILAVTWTILAVTWTILAVISWCF
jgi:hypothetical protein